MPNGAKQKARLATKQNSKTLTVNSAMKMIWQEIRGHKNKQK